MKLLVVDDSKVIRKVIRAVADALSLDVEEAQNGTEALEKLALIYKEVCLVLLDWNMPKRSGYDVLLEIKRDERFQDIPVMMVTTEGKKSNIVAAVRAGACNYLAKPFTVEELEAKILECLQEEGEE